MYFKKV